MKWSRKPNVNELKSCGEANGITNAAWKRGCTRKCRCKLRFNWDLLVNTLAEIFYGGCTMMKTSRKIEKPFQSAKSSSQMLLASDLVDNRFRLKKTHLKLNMENLNLTFLLIILRIIILDIWYRHAKKLNKICYFHNFIVGTSDQLETSVNYCNADGNSSSTSSKRLSLYCNKPS